MRRVGFDTTLHSRSQVRAGVNSGLLKEGRSMEIAYEARTQIQRIDVHCHGFPEIVLKRAAAAYPEDFRLEQRRALAR